MSDSIITQEKYFKPDQIPLGLLLSCFVISIVFFICLVGDIGFQGDDWWIFGIPYWNNFPDSLLIYAKESKRPIEGFYWILMYEMFGLYEPAFLAGSLVLLAVSCLLMTKCLFMAFPDYKNWALMSGLLAFVITPLANLIFMLHTDNSRISCIFFWVSTLLFQNWAKEPEKNSRLFLPTLFYCLATLTYENCALLIFSIPFLVTPVFKLYNVNDSIRKFLRKLCLAISVSFAAFVAIRFIIFQGGAVSHKSLTPPTELAFSYIRILLDYLLVPMTTIELNLKNLLWASLFTSFAYMISIGCSRNHVVTPMLSKQSSDKFNLVCMSLVSFSILGFGMAPYLLAGYSPELGFTSQSRIYSSAGFGVAAIVCLPLIFCRGKRAFSQSVGFLLLAFIFVNALSQISLRTDWIQARVYRDNITKSLLTSVPKVDKQANFLFLDLQWYISNNAVVFQGVDGINEWIKILYKNRKAHAYFLYTSQDDQNKDGEKSAIVTSKGIIPRGAALRGPLPLDRLILTERKGDEVTVLKSISKNDDKILAIWEGMDSIKTNYELISKTD